VSFHQREGVRRVLNRSGVERSMLITYFEKNNTSDHGLGGHKRIIKDRSEELYVPIRSKGSVTILGFF
jgi:hypothetical protein